MILHQYEDTPPCPGMNCGGTDGKHSKECIAEHTATLARGFFGKWVAVADEVPGRTYEEVIVHPRPTDYCCEAHHDGKGNWFYGEYEPNFGHVTHKCQVTHWLKGVPPSPNQ